MPELENQTQVEPTLQDIVGKVLTGEQVSNIPDPFIEPGQNNQTVVPDIPPKQLSETQIDWVFTELKNRLHKDDSPWELPEEIKTGKTKEGKELTTQDKFDIFLNTVYNNTNFQDPDEDDFVRTYKEAKKDPQFDKSKFFQQYSKESDIFDLPSKEYLDHRYKSIKNEKGEKRYTDEQVKSYLDGKNLIDLDREAESLKYNDKQILEKQRTDNMVEYKKVIDKNITDWENNRKPIIDSVVNTMSKQNNIGGLPHSETDMKEFEPIFRDLMSVDKDKGQLKLDSYLQSDSNRLYTILYAAHKMEKGGIQKVLSDLKEGIKNDILGKTGIVPTISSSDTTSMGLENPPTSSQLF